MLLRFNWESLAEATWFVCAAALRIILTEDIAEFVSICFFIWTIICIYSHLIVVVHILIVAPIQLFTQWNQTLRSLPHRCLQVNARSQNYDLVKKLPEIDLLVTLWETVEHRCGSLSEAYVSHRLTMGSLLDVCKVLRDVLCANLCIGVVEELFGVWDRIQMFMSLTVSSSSIVREPDIVTCIHEERW